MASIYVYSPSGAVRDKAAFKRGIQALKILGHDVEVDPEVLSSVSRFAGTDNERMQAIRRAAQSRANVAMITRGGYGMSRLLQVLPYRDIAAAINNGTVFVGLSDFTAFQMAIYAKNGLPSWAGPALLSDFGAAGGPDEIMLSCFEDLVTKRGEGAGWRLGSVKSKTLLSNSLKKRSALHIEDQILWGGNLSMVCSLLGTPFFPEIKNGILFLEDIGEHPYRVERMLMQLMQAGVLTNQKAIIFGSFTEYKITPHDRGYSLHKAFEYLQTLVKVPIICDLPFGHTGRKICLPFGQKVTLVTEGPDIFLFWNQHSH